MLFSTHFGVFENVRVFFYYYISDLLVKMDNVLIIMDIWSIIQNKQPLEQRMFLNDLFAPIVTTHEFSKIRCVGMGMSSGHCDAVSMSTFRIERLFPPLHRGLPANV